MCGLASGEGLWSKGSPARLLTRGLHRSSTTMWFDFFEPKCTLNFFQLFSSLRNQFLNYLRHSSARGLWDGTFLTPAKIRPSLPPSSSNKLNGEIFFFKQNFSCHLQPQIQHGPTLVKKSLKLSAQSFSNHFFRPDPTYKLPL